MNELNDIDNEIFRYIDGLTVSDDFIKRLDKDKELQEKVIMLKSDLYMMDKIKYSKMFNSIKKESRIKIKNGIVSSMSGLILVTQLQSRNSEDEKPKIYNFQNGTIILKDKIATLNIEHIEKYCKIIKDGIEIVNISSLREYSTILEKGKYNILLDDKNIDIEIE